MTPWILEHTAPRVAESRQPRTAAGTRRHRRRHRRLSWTRAPHELVPALVARRSSQPRSCSPSSRTRRGRKQCVPACHRARTEALRSPRATDRALTRSDRLAGSRRGREARARGRRACRARAPPRRARAACEPFAHCAALHVVRLV
jgi:hypothetical protein